MRGDFEAPWLFKVAAVFVALFFFISFSTYAASILVSGCWKNALKELEPLSASKRIGFGALLGREKIKLPVTMNTGCVDKVAFTDHDGCKELCRQFPGDRSDCYKACDKCHEKEGCIVALPTSGGFLNKVKNFFTLGRWKEKPNSWISYYAFDRTVIEAEDHKNKVVCLDFTLHDGSYTISIEEVEIAEDCTVEE